MTKTARYFTSLIVATLFLPGFAEGGEKANSTPQKIGDFTLKSTSGKDVTLSQFKNKKAFVIAFLGTECPINNAYCPRLVDLDREYSEKGVQFIGINANSQDTPDRVSRHVKEYKISFPVLKDALASVADQFGAKRTPEIFILDADHVVRYRGRIDDQYGIGFKRAAPTHTDLKNAIDELLGGKPISVSLTDAPGCLISRPTKPKSDAKVTFAKEVSRIIQKNCQECHRPGQVGPMPFLTYDDVAPWADTIYEVISENRMPPWHADHRYGKFINDRSLAATDRETLLEWIKEGCPKGDDKDLPPPKEFAQGWTIGKPDVVFTMPEAFTVPAETPKGGVPYKLFKVETHFTEDKWIQAAEAKPGNPAVVHHIIVYVIKKGERRRPSEDAIGEGWLTPYAPGDMPAVMAPGTAKKVPKGAILVFQMHYTPNGTEQTDRSSVGLIFAKEPPKYEMHTRSITNERFTIPAGEANQRVYTQSTFHEDAVVYGLLPHMHLRGKDFEFKLVHPDGTSEILLSVPRYDFNWQSNYRLKEPLTIPAGSRIECTAHFDNSTGNPNNPNPKEDVHWGDQTWQEMMIGFVDYVYKDKPVK